MLWTSDHEMSRQNKMIQWMYERQKKIAREPSNTEIMSNALKVNSNIGQALSDGIRRNMDNREYDQLDSLTSSTNTEISRLSVIAKNLRIRLESLEKNQTDLMDKINELQKEMADEEDPEGDDN